MRRYSIISNIVLTLAIFAQGFAQAGGKPQTAPKPAAPSAPKKHPFTFEDMMALKRVGRTGDLTRRQMGTVLRRGCQPQ